MVKDYTQTKIGNSIYALRNSWRTAGSSRVTIWGVIIQVKKAGNARPYLEAKYYNIMYIAHHVALHDFIDTCTWNEHPNS